MAPNLGKFRRRVQRRIGIVYRRHDDLVLNPKNPRIHSKRQIAQIARSIKTFGFLVPVLIDEERNVVAGHGRIMAARELEQDEVPTIQVEHLSKEQLRALAIADNRLTENSSWDDTLLAQELKALSALDLDFSLEATGFEVAEIDLRIQQLDVADEGDNLDDHDIPLPPAQPITQLGDLWHLGPHRILCGNSLEKESYEKLMPGETAAVAVNDLPFNVPIHGHATGNGKVKHRDFAMACGEMNRQEFTAFLTKAIRLIADHSAEGSISFTFMDFRHLPEILAAGEAVYNELKNLCVWVKDRAGMGSLYRSQHELVLVWKKGKSPHRNNVQLGRFGRYRSNVWNYPSAASFSRSGEEGNLLALHPTVKPTGLVSDAILDVSARGDIVLDAFLGSGTTLIAAERTGRVCRGIELDPGYVDVAIQRWEKLTGKKAIHESGRAFGRADL